MTLLHDDAALAGLMASALEEARAALAHDDVPIGALVADRSGAIVARAHNERELRHDPTAHAEILALQAAARALGRWRLDDCLLVVTLEPCPMCAGAAVNARIGGVVFGPADPRAGACGTLYHLGTDPRLNHEFAVVPGIQAAQGAALLTEFFAARR